MENSVEEKQEGLVLKLSACRRCGTCHRIFTPRQRLLRGWCSCGSGSFKDVGILCERDIATIEENYGWDVTLDLEGTRNAEHGLLPNDDGKVECELDETRLHSRGRAVKNEENEKRSQILGVKNWWDWIPTALRSRNRWQDALKKTKRRAGGEGSHSW